MMDNNNKTKNRSVECDGELLNKLLHLKRYETPEAARMTRCRQNIMREIRQSRQDRRRGLADLLEIRFPWFFAEPKYGIALLFVGFVGLQYLAVNKRYEADPGIYIQPSIVAQEEAVSEPDGIVALTPENEGYSQFPDNPEDFTLLRTPRDRNSYVKPVMVGFLREE
ncbi:MAG: hypothetical protein JXR40_14165 [Pontiellaceae bacterium]|nr:hypothetical protein [Pontiellaceae bacterium]